MTKRKWFLIFIFYFVLLCLSPISGDDWGNYLVGSTGLYHSIGNAVGMYFSWEGRFISRVLINILTYHKILWNFVNAFSIVFLLYLVVKIIGCKKKSIYFLIFLIIPFMNIYMFSQVITWIAGNLTYFFLVPFMFLYFIYVFKGNRKWWFLLGFNLFIPMFIEHMAIVFVCFNLFFIFYNYFINKKFDFKLILFTIISIGSTLLMLLSPGSAFRSSIENVYFNNLSIFDKVIYNIPSFIYYTFISNYYLLFLFVISNYFIIKNNFRNLFYKWGLILFLSIIPIVTIILYFISVFKGINIFSNLFFIIYYFIFLIISFVLVIKEGNYYSIFFFIIGVMSNVIMLLSPTWGYRTSLFTYICLCVSCIIIISKYFSDNKLLCIILNYGYLVVLLFYMVLYINVFICQRDLKKSINEQLNNGSSVISVIRFPSFINCNINPDNDYHLGKFKEYYGIPSSSEIEFIDGKWKFIFYNK